MIDLVFGVAKPLFLLVVACLGLDDNNLCLGLDDSNLVSLILRIDSAFLDQVAIVLVLNVDGACSWRQFTSPAQ